jgi:hypothetical protein
MGTGLGLPRQRLRDRAPESTRTFRHDNVPGEPYPRLLYSTVWAPFGRATVSPPPSGFPWGQISSIELLSPQARPVQCTGDFTAQQTVSAVVWVWERIWAGLSGV